MTPMHLEANGTLLADGTLRFDAVPGLPPGRVRAVLQSLDAPAAAFETLSQHVARVRLEAEARGHRFQTGEEIHALIEELRTDPASVAGVP